MAIPTRVRSICIVTQQYRSVYSGIGVHSRNLLAGLTRDGHKVFLLTQASQLDTVPNGVQVRAVPGSFLQSSQARWIPLAWHFARALCKLNAAERFDIVHFTDARESILFARDHTAVVGNVNDYYAAQMQPLGYYREHYTDALQRWLYYAFVHQCERIAFRRLGAVIANSDYTLSAVQSAYHLDHQRLFKCLKCMDESQFERIPHSPPASGLILFAGGNMQRKGLRTLIQAAPQILRTRSDVKFVVVGTDRNSLKMQEMCRELKISDRFHFVGWITNEQLRTLYRRASVFVMPSLMEAFGMTLLEAMASDTPVVATRVGGIPELVRHGENGLLVEPSDPRGLAKSLLEILENSDLAKQLGAGGLETARRFGIEQMLSCTYRVYESLLGEPL